MNINRLPILALVLLSCTFCAFAKKKNYELYCGACQAVINELEHEISKVDPKKVVDVGGFRIDPEGKTKTKKVDLGRSDIFLVDAVERVCRQMKFYAAVTNETTDETKFIRAISHAGEYVQHNDIVVSLDLSKSLAFAVQYARSSGHITDLFETVCETISNDYVVADASSGEKTLKRMVTHDGKMSGDIDFNKLMEQTQQSGDKPPDADSKRSRFICETIIEDYEDDILSLLSRADHNAKHDLCVDIADYCKASEIEQPPASETTESSEDDSSTNEKEEL